LFNGDVELDIEGDRSMIEELIKEIKIGPRFAHITDMVIRWKEVDKHYKTIEIL
jgi:acylphosphatase